MAPYKNFPIMNEEIDIEQLEIGTKVEMEHTKNIKHARKIALDHLNERPDYYKKIDQVMPDEVPGDNS